MFLDNVLTGGIKGIVGGVADLIDRFVTTPDEKAKALIALRELEVRETEAITTAASAAIVAEAQSGDPVVRRARPLFLYVVYLILLWNFFFLPIVQLVTSQPLSPINFPTELYTLFGAGYLGYAGARTYEKANGK